MLWGKFSLGEAEQAGVSMESTEMVPMVKRGNHCLIGKLIADRILPKDFLKIPLLRAWRPTGEVSFNPIGDNMFVVEFEHMWVKSRIMEGRPWLYDGNLVSLKEFDGLTPPSNLSFDMASFWVRMYNLPLACMGKTAGQKLGESVGLVEEVDVAEGEAGWGEFLRVKVSIDITKPLARGRVLHVPNQSIWVAFKYEKLPKFCYNCGIIKHSSLGCADKGRRHPQVKEDALPYGSWLRVMPPYRQGGGEASRGQHTGRKGSRVPQRDPGIGEANRGDTQMMSRRRKCRAKMAAGE